MSRFLSEEYRELSVYTPGEQPKDRKYIKLNTNESPFPASGGVIDAISREQIELLRLYPDPTCFSLRKKIAGLFGKSYENIYLANGSDDILSFAFMIFAQRGVAFPEISYGFYEVFARLYGKSFEKIPLKEDFSIDYKDYMNKNKLIVIANPNAPTGIALGLFEIEQIVKSNPESVVLIDEAYVDFGAQSAAGLTERYDNLLVVQTFSKSRCLAGARLGFAVGSRELINDLERIKYSTNPYNVNRLTQAAGEAAIDENEYYVKKCRQIVENREYASRELMRLGFTLTKSSANFIFAKSDKIGGFELYERLKEKGILVRHFSDEKIADYNRITVGSLGEMTALVMAIKEILGENE